MKHLQNVFFHSFGILRLTLKLKLNKELFAIPSGDNKSKVSTHINCTYLNIHIYTKIQNDSVVSYCLCHLYIERTTEIRKDSKGDYSIITKSGGSSVCILPWKIPI